MKKLFGWMAALAMCVALVGCGEPKVEPTTPPAGTEATTPPGGPGETAAPTGTETTTPPPADPAAPPADPAAPPADAPKTEEEKKAE